MFAMLSTLLLAATLGGYCTPLLARAGDDSGRLHEHMGSGGSSQPDGRAIRGGLVLFGAAYTVAVGGAASRDLEDGTRWLLVPVGGPWIALGSGADANGWGLAMLGVSETAGAALVAYGFLQPRRFLGPPASFRVRAVLPTATLASPLYEESRSHGTVVSAAGLRLLATF